MIISEDDKFYIECTKEERKELLTRKYGPGSLSTMKWFGEFKSCPTCEKVRVTSCCACGCGKCLTCDHRFVCNPGMVAALNPLSSFNIQEFSYVSKPVNSEAVIKNA